MDMTGVNMTCIDLYCKVSFRLTQYVLLDDVVLSDAGVSVRILYYLLLPHNASGIHKAVWVIN